MDNVFGKDKTITVKPAISSWDVIRPVLLLELEEAGFTDDVSVSFLVAAEEMFANAVMYAFPEGISDDDMISVGFDIGQDSRGQYAEIVLSDTGVAFDPTKIPQHEPVTSAKGLTPGGFGITLARQKTDRMIYKREQGQNRLSLIRYK